MEALEVVLDALEVDVVDGRGKKAVSSFAPINQRARCAHQELLRLLGVKVTLDIVTVIGHVHGVRWSDLNYAVSR